MKCDAWNELFVKEREDEDEADEVNWTAVVSQARAATSQGHFFFVHDVLRVLNYLLPVRCILCHNIHIARFAPVPCSRIDCLT